MTARALLAAFFLALLTLGAHAADRLTVFAAASMKDAMDRAAAAYTERSGVPVAVSFAASSVLARQIAAGAPADLYVSANKDWMDWLITRDAVRGESLRTVAGNSLVIAAAKAFCSQVESPDMRINAEKQGDRAVQNCRETLNRSNTAPGAGPRALLGARFAMGDPSHVPAGQYARAALESLGLWRAVEANAVFGENVRVALQLAGRGEVDAAIVYGSDQRIAEGLARAYTFPADSHPPIVYPAALTRNAAPGAQGFLDFLTSRAGRAIFADLGFSPPAQRAGQR